MKAALLCLCASIAAGQPALTLTAGAIPFPGGRVLVNIGLTGSAGLNISAIQFRAYDGPDAALMSDSNVWIGYNYLSNDTFTDCIVASFVYQIPMAAPLGTLVMLTLSNAQALTRAGALLLLGSPSLTIPVGVTASCLASIQSSIKFFLALPGKLALDAVQLRIKTASNTGTCQ